MLCSSCSRIEMHSRRLIGVKWTWLASRARILSLYLHLAVPTYTPAGRMRLIVSDITSSTLRCSPYKKEGDDLGWCVCAYGESLSLSHPPIL